MGYTALYRKYRPLTFSELVGQDHITRTLKNQIMANRVGHAYLFSGGRGTGKTSSAKILARAINCLNPIDGEPCNECEMCKAQLNGSLTDVVEMDAASNNGVEDIRSIREEVNFLPTKAKYRIYIIDEVHMLSIGAFNALLKTLEEPPEHVKFILATTEPQKLPATILSRCQRFDFKRIQNEDIIKRLKIICKDSNIEITEGALNIIAVLAEGAMRDALSILERCLQDGDNNIDEDKIKDLVGIPKTTFVHNISKAIIEYNADDSLKAIDDILNEGKDLDNFLWEIIKYIKDILVYKTSGKLEIYNEKEQKDIKELADNVDKKRLIDLIYELSELQTDMKWSTQKIIMFEAGIIKLCSKEFNNSNNGNNSNLEERVSKIENYLRTARPVVDQGKQQINQNRNTFISKPVQNTTINTSKSTTNNSSLKHYSSDLSKSWPQMVTDLKQNGRIVLYTNLKGSKAQEIDDKTVEIKFSNGLSDFGKTILKKQENINEISSLIRNACGKQMNIKYSIEDIPKNVVSTPESELENLANNLDIPFSEQ